MCTVVIAEALIPRWLKAFVTNTMVLLNGCNNVGVVFFRLAQVRLCIGSIAHPTQDLSDESCGIYLCVSGLLTLEEHMFVAAIAALL